MQPYPLTNAKNDGKEQHESQARTSGPHMTTIEKLDPTRLVPGATGRMVDAGTTRLYCVEAGHGRPIVLVGGWPQSLYCWRYLLPVLARTHRVIACDPPGLG